MLRFEKSIGSLWIAGMFVDCSFVTFCKVDRKFVDCRQVSGLQFSYSLESRSEVVDCRHICGLQVSGLQVSGLQAEGCWYMYMYIISHTDTQLVFTHTHTHTHAPSTTQHTQRHTQAWTPTTPSAPYEHAEVQTVGT